MGYIDLLLYCRDIHAKVWTHMVFVWNRSTRIGRLYLNGESAGEQHYTGQDIDLNLTTHTTYELGFEKGKKHTPWFAEGFDGLFATTYVWRGFYPLQ